ncbi:hypothetical protein SteCoe_25296 [Stentor coeruleus]|uniref:Uncharacterized protein n=1 Tax=Stentor coeruleus TaxID=5963 RepID=A0A1R2BFN4_9CILI|nr:hypothetical protein SteCoe_25296 [Stentor coeruleus]
MDMLRKMRSYNNLQGSAEELKEKSRYFTETSMRYSRMCQEGFPVSTETLHDIRMNFLKTPENFENKMLEPSLKELAIILACYQEIEISNHSLVEHFQCLISFYIASKRTFPEEAKTLLNEEFRKIIRKLTNYIFDVNAEINSKQVYLMIAISWYLENSSLLVEVNFKRLLSQLILLAGILNSINLGYIEVKALELQITELVCIKDINIFNKVFKYCAKVFENCFPQQTAERDFLAKSLEIKEFKNAYRLAKSIDKLMPKYFNFKICYESGYNDKMIQIIDDNLSVLLSAFEKYLDTETFGYSDFENSLILIMHSFLKLFQEVVADGESIGTIALKKFYKYETKVKLFFKFTQIIRALNKFCPISRFIATELLISMVKRGRFDYFAKISSLKYFLNPIELPENLLKLFIETALRFPYRGILLKFCPQDITENEFENIIKKSISNVRLVEMPKYITGLTLSNNMICIKKVSNIEPFFEGAMFYVILHELAHLLQRARASNFREISQSRSGELIQRLEQSEEIKFLKLNTSKFTFNEAQNSEIKPFLIESESEIKQKYSTEKIISEAKTLPEPEEFKVQDPSLHLKANTQNFDFIKINPEDSVLPDMKAQKIQNQLKTNSSNIRSFNPGEYLEYILFGDVYKNIYESAANFVLTIYDGSIQNFQEDFQKLMKMGEITKEKKSIIRCLESTEENCYHIKKCGTKGIVKAILRLKPEKKV